MPVTVPPPLPLPTMKFTGTLRTLPVVGVIVISPVRVWFVKPNGLAMNVTVAGEPLTTLLLVWPLTKSQLFGCVTCAVPIDIAVVLVVDKVNDPVCVNPPLTALTETGDGLAVNTPLVVPPPPPPPPGVALLMTLTDTGVWPATFRLKGSPLQTPLFVQSENLVTVRTTGVLDAVPDVGLTVYHPECAPTAN